MTAPGPTATQRITLLRQQAEQFRRLAQTSSGTIRDQALDLAHRCERLADLVGNPAQHRAAPPSGESR